MTNKQFAVLMETLIRIEHKLDQNLHATTAASLMLTHSTEPLGSRWAACPLCGLVPEIHVEPKEAYPYRTCGCRSGKAPGIALDDLAPLVPTKGVPHVGDEDLGDGAGGDAGSVVPDGTRR